jgi:hypothetical protein
MSLISIGKNEYLESMESYTWCNKDEKQDCVQIRQDNRTNTICLQYISCVVQSHFICEGD